MKSFEDKMSDASKVLLVDAIQSLVDLYAARKAVGDDIELEKWKTLLNQENGNQN